MTKTRFKPIHSSKLVGRMVDGVPKGTKSYIAAKTRELKEQQKIIFSKEIAESVIGTFELIIKTVEGTNQTSITVDQLKHLKKVMQKKYYNKKVILQ